MFKACFTKSRLHLHTRTSCDSYGGQAGGDVSKPITEYRMTVHLFGATSSSSCASYALTKAAEDNKDIHSTEAINTVKTNFYVDDCLRYNV